MDLEKIATSAIVSSISKTDTLSGFINDGDKEPCWDGNIYIHENSRHSKKNIKRIPTQVKGKAVKTKSVKDKIKYRVKYDDLKAYMMDGGTLFFVVYIEKETGEALQIYYADLLPIRIMKILEQTQDSYSIDFFSFPSDNKEKIEVVLNAYNDAQRQKSFAGKRLPTIDELNRKGIMESLSFHVTHVGKEISPNTIPQVMEGKSITLYANIKGNPIGIPVEQHQNITQVTTCQKFDKKIFVNGIEYYNHYLVLHSAFDTKLIIGNCLTMTTPVVADANESSIKTTIHINVKGTLREQIKGFEFIQAVYANNGYEIENTHISILLKEKHFEEKIQGYSNRLSWLKYILDLLKSMHVKKDLEIENFSEEDEKNLNFLIAAHGKHKPVREEERQLECLQLLKISNISLGVIYIKHTDGYYYMHDYFGEHLESYWKDGDKATRISQFTVMTMADFLKYDNIRLPMIADDFKLLPCSEEIINEANLLMLEMIKAYDKSKNDELLVTAKKINDWLQEHPKLIGREVCIINKYQIKIRKTYLGYSDKAELFSIIEKSENNNYRAGAFILLGEFDEAKKIFDSYGEEQMQEFINYPIYTLYQQSGENLM